MAIGYIAIENNTVQSLRKTLYKSQTAEEREKGMLRSKCAQLV